MDFSKALQQAKSGLLIAREGWNGKGMYVYMVPENPENKIRAYLMMFTAQGDLVPWLASQTDLLAEDWVTVK